VESGLIVDIVVAMVALTIFAFASVSELGGGAVTRRRLHAIQEEIRSGKRTTHAIVEASRIRTASIEVVRIVAIVLAAVAIEDGVDRIFDEVTWLLDAVILTFVLLLAGVGLPRAVLAAAPESWLELIARFVASLAKIAAPLLRLADAIATPSKWLLPGRDGALIATEDEIRDSVQSRAEDEALQAAEQEMIDGVLQLEDLAARDIMVPRPDMISASINTPPRQLLQMITASGYSRIPIYDHSIDEILGVLHAKDLLPFVMRDGRDVQIRPLIRPAYIVPESKRVDELLRDMRVERQQIAILADEYGGIAGLVSIEDVVEQIVGNIHDEYDSGEEDVFKISDDIFEFNGSVSMTEIEDDLDLNEDEIDDEDFDTIGGFVLKHLGRLPIEGDVVEANGLRVNVLKVERHRVGRVRVEHLHPRPNEESSQSNGDEDTE
jgi:CBS domain containing-hemolysin-like protein